MNREEVNTAFYRHPIMGHNEVSALVISDVFVPCDRGVIYLRLPVWLVDTIG